MNKKSLVIVSSIVIVALLIFLTLQISENIKKQKEIDELKKDRLKLIQEYLKIASEIPSEIKSQIVKLVTEYKSIDEDVAQELISILQLIETKQESKAIFALAKIVENLLKDKYAEEILQGRYANNKEFNQKKKKLIFKQVIDFAKEQLFLSENECNLINILREYRNEEGHSMNVKIEKNWQTIAFLTGIEIVFKLKGEK